MIISGIGADSLTIRKCEMKVRWKTNRLACLSVPAAIGTYAVLTLIAKAKRPASIYDDASEQKNPFEGKRVVFVSDEHDSKNADGKRGHLEATSCAEGNSTFYEAVWKTVLDKTLSFCGLVVLSPVLIGLSLAIVIDDPGPVLFTQKRIGKNKQFFKLHKFRSMKMSTPHDVPTHMLDNPEQYITRVGMRLVPVKPKKYGLVTTGNEVFYGRIEDTFTPVIQAKMKEFGCEMQEHVILNDDHEKITAAIKDMLEKGCEMVVCTGGMSVDPDDKTPLAIKNSGVNIVSYGAPVLPGAMFLLSYTDDGRPVCGLPGCVMYAKRTIFDLILPYLVTDVPVTKEHLAGLGHGGLCLNCKVCHFPNCGFGKGV